MIVVRGLLLLAVQLSHGHSRRIQLMELLQLLQVILHTALPAPALQQRLPAHPQIHLRAQIAALLLLLHLGRRREGCAGRCGGRVGGGARGEARGVEGCLRPLYLQQIHSQHLTLPEILWRV